MNSSCSCNCVILDSTAGKATHNGTNTISDSFGFTVSDGTDELTAQTFHITINPVDDDVPTIVTKNKAESIILYHNPVSNTSQITGFDGTTTLAN